MGKTDIYKEGEIWIDNGKCEICGAKTEVLLMDSSKGESEPKAICQSCTDNIFVEYSIYKR